MVFFSLLPPVLLQSFLEVESITRNYKGKLVSVILAGYLSLKRLVVQRTKRIDESQELLLRMLEDLTSGTEQEKEEFMATCVKTLNRFKDSDLLTPIFVFERLCSIIHPVSPVAIDVCVGVEVGGCVHTIAIYLLKT